MKLQTLSVVTCLAVLACSGKYEVGTDPDAAGAGKSSKPNSAAGGSFGGASSAGNGDPVQAMGGTTFTAGSAAVGATYGDVSMGCGVPASAPEPLPTSVTNVGAWWNRLSYAIWGSYRESPIPLPTATFPSVALPSYVDAVLDMAKVEDGQRPAGEAFLVWWIQLDRGEPDAAAPLWGIDWMVLLDADQPALDVLLTKPFDSRRVGIFSEQTFLTRFPTISQRGTTMVMALFNQDVPREPPGLDHMAPPAGWTRREALEAGVSQPVCSACHHFIDPLGYALENFDDVGGYQTMDAGKPVDSSGSYDAPKGGGTIEFNGISELGAQLRSNCAANLGFSEQFLTYALRAAGSASPDFEQGFTLDQYRMYQAYLNNGRTLRSLIHAYAEGLAIRLP